jgi:hypothetical protein
MDMKNRIVQLGVLFNQRRTVLRGLLAVLRLVRVGQIQTQMARKRRVPECRVQQRVKKTEVKIRLSGRAVRNTELRVFGLCIVKL